MPGPDIAGSFAASGDDKVEAEMAKSSYVIRIAGAVPRDLLENFHQIDTVEPAGTILWATQLDDAALWGLINALRNAGIDVIDVRREVAPSQYESVPNPARDGPAE